MGKSYYKKKSNSWTKVFQDGVKDIFNGIGKNISSGRFFIVNSNCNPAARVCIFVLIGLTLLFSGLGLYTCLILIMLLIILQFV